MKLVGIDLSTNPKNCGICIIEDDEVAYVGQGSRDTKHPAKIREYCTGANVVALDVPFGWPKPFATALAEYNVGHALDANRERYRLRTTDIWLVQELPQQFTFSTKPPNPFSVSADKLGGTAMMGTMLLQALSDEFELSPRNGQVRPAVIETYPAASLWAWGLPYKDYKTGNNAKTVRATILAGLEDLYGFHLENYREILLGSDHCLDALIAAFTARAYADHRTFDPPADIPDEVLDFEGWIRIPNFYSATA